MPGLEMSRFGWPDTEQDSQNLHVAHSQCQRRIKAVAALFDGGEGECRRVGYCLNMIIGREAGVRSWNCCELAFVESRDSLWKCKARLEIGIGGATAVASPPPRVQR